MALKDWKQTKRAIGTFWDNTIEDEKIVGLEPSVVGTWIVWYLFPNDSFVKMSTRKYRAFPTKVLAMKFVKKLLRDN